MVDKFDNLSVTDLIARETEARAEHLLLISAIKRRLYSECPVVLGRVHRLKGLETPHGRPHPDNGRKIIPVHFYVEYTTWDRDSPVYPWRVLVGGPVENPRSTTGTGYNRKERRYNPEHFEPIEGTAGDGPGWATNYVSAMRDFII